MRRFKDYEPMVPEFQVADTFCNRGNQIFNPLHIYVPSEGGTDLATKFLFLRLSRHHDTTFSYDSFPVASAELSRVRIGIAAIVDFTEACHK